jgi:hypothetical protein
LEQTLPAVYPFRLGLDLALQRLALSLVVISILLFTGWRGWEMVYRPRVGVAVPDERPAAATSSTRRAA